MSLIEAQRLSSIELSLIRQIMQNAPQGSINLALGELGFPMPEILRQHAMDVLATETPNYTPNAGMEELRSAVASQYQSADSGNICVCNGAEEAIFLSLFSLLNPGDSVAIPDPDYTAYPTICKMLGANVIRMPYESKFSRVDWDKWEALLGGKVKLLILSNPSNPSGHMFSTEELQKLITICERHKVIILVDEIYKDLYLTSQPPSLAGMTDNLLLVGGLSKSHCLSGWRIGWVSAPKSIIGSIIKARQYVSTCSNWLSQKLAVYALSESGIQAVEQVRTELILCRNIAESILGVDNSRIHYPDATPYIMLNTEIDDLQTCKELAGKGVLCVPGSAFGEVSRGWVRINTAVDKDKLKSALEIVADELHLH